MKFGLTLFPLYLYTGLISAASANPVSASSNATATGTGSTDQKLNRSSFADTTTESETTEWDLFINQDENRDLSVTVGPNPEAGPVYFNVSHHQTEKSGIIIQENLDLSFRKEWTEEEKIDVEVQKCPGSDIDAAMTMSGRWFQVPQLYQVPLSSSKADKISGRFRNGLFNFTLVSGGVGCVNESTLDVYGFSLAESASFREGLNNGSRNANGLPIHLKYTKYIDYFSPYGDLKTYEYHYQYPPRMYCISSLTAETIAVQTCDPRERNPGQPPPTGKLTPKNESVVVTKCCPPGLVIQYNETSTRNQVSCVETSEEEWTPYFFRRFHTLATDFGYSASGIDTGVAGEERPYYRHRKLNCKTGLFRFVPNEGSEAGNVAQIRMLESGEILTRPTGQHEWDRPKQTATSSGYIDSTLMCIDGLVNVNDATTTELTYTRSPSHQIILYCPRPEDNSHDKFSLVYFCLLCVTSVFLATNVVVYVLIWKSQNIHGWTTAAFSTFVFLCHLSTALGQGATVFAHQRIILFQSYTCVAIGIVNLYSYIAMFSWMTILNFDLWVAISSMTPVSNRGKGTKRFLIYCAIALGVPLIVVTIALGFEHGFGLFDEGVIRPLFGRFVCGVDSTAYIYYHILPCLILFLVNVVFAILTIISLYTWKQDTKRINKSNSKACQSQWKLMFKLCVLMGFSWIFDILSWCVAGTELSWYWGILDAFNILQALALFWIFVCKKEVKDELCKSYSAIKSVSDWIETTSKKGRYSSSSAVPGVLTVTHSTNAPSNSSTSNADQSASVSLSSSNNNTNDNN